jgi:hypothetical protein
MTVDGTDFKVYELLPFDPKWLSHKFNAPAVRYKVALLICSSDIVWINGPFWACEWPDIKIFCRDLIHELEGGEKVQADRGYRGEGNYSRVPSRYNQDGKVAWTGQEMINHQFKHWGCLNRVFRHNKAKHQDILCSGRHHPNKT